MKHTGNSRRNFLGIMALLTSGTVLAGSPLALLDEDDQKEDLKKSWETLLQQYNATGYLTIGDIQLPQIPEPLKGQLHKTGPIISFEQEGILAQPTWVHWNNNSKPNDLLISFFENNATYKKIVTINRYELDAMLKLSSTTNSESLLAAICKNCKAENSGVKNGLEVKTVIQKNKRVQQAMLYKYNNIVLENQFIINA